MAHSHQGDDHSHGHFHDHAGHAHRHGAAGHVHAHDSLSWAFAATLAFAGIEALTGLWAGSLALLSDAGHMLTDSLALGLAAAAARFARRPPSARHSFGLERIEVLAALANAGFMLALVLGVVWNAVIRLQAPQPVHGSAVIGVAAVGLLINIAIAWMLSRGAKNINTRGALLHVLGDMLGSVAALAAGVVIVMTGWTPIDPLLSLFISALILIATLRLAREAVHTLLEGVPRELSLPKVGRRLASMEGVASVHDLHIWSLTSSRPILTAHIVLHDVSHWNALLPEILGVLKREFGIDHATLQPEPHTPTFYRIHDPERPPGG